MNKRQSGEAVLRGGLASKEVAARAINAEPWDPLPGMTKAQCAECRYFFATPVTATAALLCPDCAAEGTRPAAGVFGKRNPQGRSPTQGA